MPEPTTTPEPTTVRNLLWRLNARLGTTFPEDDPITEEGLADNVYALLDWEPDVGDAPEVAAKLLEALDCPLGGMDDPDEVAVSRLADELAADEASTDRLLKALLDRRLARTIDLSKVAGLLAGRGIPVVVEHTGGGVATLYAGERRPDREGADPTVDRYPAAAGPGYFAGSGYQRPVAPLADLWVGPDDHHQATLPGVPADADEHKVADLIGDQVDRTLARWAAEAEHGPLPELPPCPNCGDVAWKLDDEVTVRVSLIMGYVHRAMFDRAGGDPVRLPDSLQGSLVCYRCDYQVDSGTTQGLSILHVVWAYAQRMVGDPGCEWEVLHEYRDF